jgi:spermidine synthase
VIGVLLGGLSLGNFLGGKIADHVKSEKRASWLFLAASVMTLAVLLTESPPRWLVRNPIGYFFQGEAGMPLAGGDGEFLHQALGMTGYSWGFRILFWTTVVFLVPAITMGTVSPVVAKLAVDRLSRARRTGTAIGQVYAWGMVGSILGTFLTGFVLIDVLGTKGVVLALAALLAIAAFVLGGLVHAVWAGVPIGLCLIAFLPVPYLTTQAERFGIIEPKAVLNASGDGEVAHLDESNYYYIKVTNYNENGRQNRTLVLDNLIHGYFILGHPEQLDYDYEHIYALVSQKMVDSRKAEGKSSLDPTAKPGTPLSTLFLGGGTYTFPRFLQSRFPGSAADVAEIDPAVTRANHMATGLPWPREAGEEVDGPPGIHTVWGDARQFVAKRYKGPKKYDIIFGDAFNDFSVPWHLTTTQFNGMISEMLTDDGIFMINIIDLYQSDDQAREDAANGEVGLPTDPEQAVARARKLGGFLSSWYTTAKKTFPHIYVFGTNSGYEIDEDSGEERFKPPGRGLRETFVVVASKKPLDLARLELKDLGGRYADPEFPQEIKVFAPYGPDDLKALEVRSQGIILTDDYAPVENLLAPVAATRGDE